MGLRHPKLTWQLDAAEQASLQATQSLKSGARSPIQDDAGLGIRRWRGTPKTPALVAQVEAASP
ncbi:MAG: hypothetical protein M1815_000869 [Lichina confinis]|nr:MAG: hypothetical protein M1815_000869 [Lichina confinis]